MKLSFNEMSFQPYIENDFDLYKRFEAILATYDELKKEYGYNHIITPTELSQIKIDSKKTFIQWFAMLSTKQKNRIQPILLKRPFSDDSLAERLDQTIKYYFECDNPKIEQEYCKGISTAYLLGIPTISLATHLIWRAEKIHFFEDDEALSNSKTIEVINVSEDDINANQELISYSENNCKVLLITSDTPIDQKSIKLSDDHHGNDKLLALARRMIKNEYVNGVINNLPFKPRTSLFIRSIDENGVVGITMHWEDAGYGMAIQTTGRNRRETEEIAKILREKFDK